MQSKLEITVLSGTSAGDVFRFLLDTGRNVTIGRATECDIVLQDPLVSRKHARIDLKNQGYMIADLGSTHGTVHMGFPLPPGSDESRQLSSGDEFKIGNMLFRVEFDDAPFRAKQSIEKTLANAPTVGAGKIPPALRPWLRGRKGAMIAAIAILLLVFLLLPSDGPQAIPQRSGEILSVPSYRVIGYFGARSRGPSESKDGSHFDKAQFDIPATDILVEYEFYSETPVAIRVDETLVEEIKPREGVWRQRQLIIRGVALGRERRLIFDNLAPETAPGQNSKQWGVRDIRATPLSALPSLEGAGFLGYMKHSAGLAEDIDKGQAGLFVLVRSLQSAVVALLSEQRIDAASYDVEVSGEAVVKVSNIPDLQQRLDAIITSYEASSTSPEQARRNLTALLQIIGDLDAELWRRVFNRINQAQISSKVKRYIDANDALVSAEQMFPGGEDYRWTLAHRLLTNDKIVPKRVREHPQDYRK